MVNIATVCFYWHYVTCRSDLGELTDRLTYTADSLSFSVFHNSAKFALTYRGVNQNVKKQNPPTNFIQPSQNQLIQISIQDRVATKRSHIRQESATLLLHTFLFYCLCCLCLFYLFLLILYCNSVKLLSPAKRLSRCVGPHKESCVKYIRLFLFLTLYDLA